MQEAGTRDADSRGDLHDRGALEASAREDLGGRIDDRLSTQQPLCVVAGGTAPPNTDISVGLSC